MPNPVIVKIGDAVVLATGLLILALAGAVLLTALRGRRAGVGQKGREVRS